MEERVHRRMRVRLMSSHSGFSRPKRLLLAELTPPLQPLLLLRTGAPQGRENHSYVATEIHVPKSQG